MKSMRGYPVRSSFALAIGGDQCKQAQQAQQQQSGDSSEGSNASSGDLSSQVGAKLGSLFRHKKDDSDTPSTPPPAAGPAGTVTLMTISSELTSVSTAPIPASAFDIPAGFKKVEPKRAS
jgi:hypothetical protein